jgi:hypothetical protein
MVASRTFATSLLLYRITYPLPRPQAGSTHHRRFLRDTFSAQSTQPSFYIQKIILALSAAFAAKPRSTQPHAQPSLFRLGFAFWLLHP